MKARGTPCVATNSRERKGVLQGQGEYGILVGNAREASILARL
jgi:hypothetical protein